MDDLPIVKRLLSAHLDLSGDAYWKEIYAEREQAAALIRAQHAALTKIANLRYVEDVNEPFDDALDIADAALAKAREA